MVKFIDDHRGAHGVEPICEMLPIAPATYYEHLAKRADPSRLSDRAIRARRKVRHFIQGDDLRYRRPHQLTLNLNSP